MKKIAGVAPEKVFDYFEALTEIPHGSFNCKAIADYCEAVAIENHCTVLRDKSDNLIITIPATEGHDTAPAVILQAHMDMVCEKTLTSSHNFTTEPLSLIVKGDWLSADGTTLGADDGIGVAMILALTEDRTIPHGVLYGVLTTEEEVGMLGAVTLDCSTIVNTPYMINLDSEDDTELLAGCAGGISVTLTWPLRYVKAKGLYTKLTLSGLDGGHSGQQIDRFGSNANILLGEILYELDRSINLSIITFNGGEKNNVIPASATAEILIGPNQQDILLTEIERLEKKLRNISGQVDQNLTITADFGETKEMPVLGRDSEALVRYAVSSIPNGVQTIGHFFDGRVDTSLNLGIVRTADKALTLCTLVRSNQVAARQRIVDRLTTFADYLGGTVFTDAAYPPWEYNKDSTLQKIMTSSYKKHFNSEVTVNITHAGLECGILSEKLPNTDIVSIGPNVPNIHTPAERLSISSTQKVWHWLCDVLETL